MHKAYRDHVFPECMHEQSGIPDDLQCRMRLRGLRGDPFLEIDDNKGGCFFINV